ncbi:MAG: hypothetical protein C4523_20775 [Myxococcales bacterium]|nr:MAG: hypothetical protein C4523_20775 [Myxococcales bacterium]
MGTIHLAPETLDELDRLDRELLVLTFFADERPLRGLSGFADWRHAGRLSRFLFEASLSGRQGEKLLWATRRKIGAPLILLYGLGPKKAFDNMIFVQTVEKLVSVASGLNVASFALSIPGAHITDDYLLERMAILLKEIQTRYDGEVTLFINRRQSFKDMHAKFLLIQEELDKLAPLGAERRAP